MTDIHEAAEALLTGTFKGHGIYDVEQKIYSNVHMEFELFEAVRAVVLGKEDGVAKIQAVYMKAAILLAKDLTED